MARYIQFDGCFLEIVQEFSLTEVSGLLYLHDNPHQPRLVVNPKQLDDFLKTDEGTKFLISEGNRWAVHSFRLEADPRGMYLRVNLKHHD